MDRHRKNDPGEQDDNEDDDHDHSVSGQPSNDEPKSLGNAEIGTDQCKHYAAPMAAALITKASANCATLPAAPEPPPNSVCVIVGTIVILRMNAMKTAITPYRFAILIGSAE